MGVKKSKASPAVPASRATSARFARTRAAHRDETASDYVEAIAQLATEPAGAAGVRVKQLAEMMGVSHVTVVRIVARLTALGLVQTARGKPINLTPAGRALAEASARRHDVVLEFLKALGVPARQAEIDAEGIEHHVSEATVRSMVRWMRAQDRT